MNKKKIIVTGAAGYIGGAICIELQKRGYYVIAVDRRRVEHLNQYHDKYINHDFTGVESFLELEKQPDAIIHCAGTSLVGPSMQHPAEYYDNNVSKTIKYLNYLRIVSPNTKFIFSSSASVYGDPSSSVEIDETFETNPISPYGDSKLMVEKILESYYKAYNMPYVSFRYFNACGAVEGGLHGQEPGATHIFARIFEALKTKNTFEIYGNDYPTEDGTCIRDYVHVTDIAKAHILAIENSLQGIYNIGSVQGYSNLEVTNKVNDILKEPLQINYNIRRQGDPAYLVADSKKLQKETGWKAEKDLTQIITDLNDWYNSDIYAKRPPAIIPL
jgi:UDP-glucose 4-epimerase